MKFSYPDGATPLDLDEVKDLIPKHISTQQELNAWEQKNILSALQWAQKKRVELTVDFIKKLHWHMFNETWKWAGQFRHSDKNIGVNWHLIPGALKDLCDDISYQIAHQTFSDDEIAVRFHHRLVWIHPFPNGNGRHARLMADLLIQQLNHPYFSWNMGGNLQDASPIRKKYIEALKEADQGNYTKLLAFARH